MSRWSTMVAGLIIGACSPGSATDIARTSGTDEHRETDAAGNGDDDVRERDEGSEGTPASVETTLPAQEETDNSEEAVVPDGSGDSSPAAPATQGEVLLEKPLPGAPPQIPEASFPEGSPELEPLPEASDDVDPSTLLAEMHVYLTEAGRVSCECGSVADDYPPGQEPDIEGCAPDVYERLPPPPVLACIDEVMSRTDVGDPNARCRRDAADSLYECLQRIRCDSERMARCERNYNRTLRYCPPLPYDLEAAVLGECWGDALPPPFVCDDGTRYSPQFVCDGHAQCASAEDEVDEYCPPPVDLGGEIACPSGNSITIEHLCNGWKTCRDGWDESPAACAENEVPTQVCADGRAIREEWWCDEVEDCLDGSDEADCP